MDNTENRSEQTQTETPVVEEGASVDNAADVASDETSNSGEATQSDDLWSTDGLDETVAERLSRIKKMYDEKDMKSSTADREIQLLKEQFEQLRNESLKTLQDPDVYKLYRKQLGYDTKDIEAKAGNDGLNLEGVQTAEDLAKVLNDYVENKLSDIERKTQAELQAKLAKATEPVTRQRWNDAANKMSERFGPDFKKVEASVFDLIRSGPWSSFLNAQGMTEEKLLEKVYRAEFPEAILKWERDKATISSKAKAKATTEKPKRKDLSKPAPKSGSVEDIIAGAEKKFRDRISKLGID